MRRKKGSEVMFGNKLGKVERAIEKKKVDKLAELMMDKDEAVRLAAIDGLGKLKAGDAVNPLITLLRDASAQVRVHAAQALGQIGDPHSKAHIIHAAQAEKDEQVKQEMVRAEALLREY